ncbi:hypothetical protein WISP_00578 [Willisornis vidua]|uniref:Uncharacterized protein n=1 Tax=Willisornis vidua TaxID=1566151 RepID=A0ABQ9DVF3_9PASS|nr:hypothetical protein WISP_00578 [Willisornis vidua]
MASWWHPGHSGPGVVAPRCPHGTLVTLLLLPPCLTGAVRIRLVVPRRRVVLDDLLRFGGRRHRRLRRGLRRLRLRLLRVLLLLLRRLRRRRRRLGQVCREGQGLQVQRARRRRRLQLLHRGMRRRRRRQRRLRRGLRRRRLRLDLH